MAQFPRPKHAITIDEFYAMPIGTVMYHVYGINPPSLGGNGIKLTQVMRFEEHDDYVDIHKNQKDSLVME